MAFKFDTHEIGEDTPPLIDFKKFIPAGYVPPANPPHTIEFVSVHTRLCARWDKKLNEFINRERRDEHSVKCRGHWEKRQPILDRAGLPELVFIVDRGGATGYESLTLHALETTCQEPEFRDWPACGGTYNSWDEMIVPSFEMDRILEAGIALRLSLLEGTPND